MPTRSRGPRLVIKDPVIDTCETVIRGDWASVEIDGMTAINCDQIAVIGEVGEVSAKRVTIIDGHKKAPVVPPEEDRTEIATPVLRGYVRGWRPDQD